MDMTDDEYNQVVARIDAIMGATPGTPEMDELIRLTLLAEKYEDENYPIGPQSR